MFNVRLSGDHLYGTFLIYVHLFDSQKLDTVRLSPPAVSTCKVMFNCYFYINVMELHKNLAKY